MRRHFEGFARYNQWANRRLYGAAAELPAERLLEDRGAFFGSVTGTLNHILVGDRVWLHRLTGEGVPPSRLDEILFADFGELRRAREAEDERLIGVVTGLTDQRLSSAFAYRNMLGDEFEQTVAEVLAHLFNHQTHHRGQVHTLLTQLGREIPPLDLVYFLRTLPR